MKYRPSKRFVYPVVIFIPLLVGLFFILPPELTGAGARSVPGEIQFSGERPIFKGNTQISTNSSPAFYPSEWVEEGYENVMRWKYNPWKRSGFLEYGGHYQRMLKSTDPADIARCKEIQQRVEEWYQKLLLRYPEMAVTMKTVPDDQNGFLKWLEFSERIKKASGRFYPDLGFSEELKHYLNDDGPWNAEAAQAWLTAQKSMVDEIRAIGLLPEASVNGVALDRWAFIRDSLNKQAADCLMMEARLHAEQGDAAAAMESIRAARGLTEHFTAVETPTLQFDYLASHMQRELEKRVLNEIIPALPAGQVDPAAWEKVLNPTVSQPPEFARIMKGTWTIAARQYILPMLLDAEDPYAPRDGGAFLDAYTLPFLEIVRAHEGATLADLAMLDPPFAPDVSQLSRNARKLAEVYCRDASSWRKVWERSQSTSGLSQAAFAIMKGEPIPQDPLSGQDYQWDPATRQLAMPAGKDFDGMKIKPITVPKL